MIRLEATRRNSSSSSGNSARPLLPPAIWSTLFRGGSEGIQAAFVKAHRGFDVFDMHVEACFDGFGLAAQQVAARDQVETLAFQFLDGEVDFVAVGSKALNHGSSLLGGFLQHSFHFFDFRLDNLEGSLGPYGHHVLHWTLMARAGDRLARAMEDTHIRLAAIPKIYPKFTLTAK